MIGEDIASVLAEAFLRFRRARRDVLPAAMFGEPAWEAMLELFVADARGQSLTARTLAQRCNASDRVMAAWLKFLTAEHLIVGDGSGHLDDPLTLSAQGLQQLEKALVHAQELRSLLDRAN